MHDLDTRIKERPDKNDSDDINSIVTELMKQEGVSPRVFPFNFLSTASCVLYTVVAFLLSKGWKKCPQQGVRKKKIK